MSALSSAHILRAAGSALVLDFQGDRAPRVLHWGADLGEFTDETIEELRIAAQLGRGHSAFDEPLSPSLTRDQAEGFLGIPAVSGHRSGRAFSPLFRVREVQTGESYCEIDLVDRSAELGLKISITLDAAGILRTQSILLNRGGDDYTVDELTVALPLSSVATHLTDFTGNWSREKHPHTRAIEPGVWSREIREGRTGHDFTLAFLAHSPAASFQSGEVWAVSLGWSGNTRHYVERLTNGTTWIGANELLLPGEMILTPGESYATPVLYAAHSKSGFDGIAAHFHDHLRARPHHVSRPRPLTINVWEAVYFNHSFDKLSELAEVAAEIGVERFVLDDGWFGSRRDDLSGLGDWVVSKDVWPNGLHPLADKLAALDLEFGLWFEPEMIQIESAAYRAHPEWVLAVDGRMPPEWRSQQVIDLVNPEAFAHVLGQMDEVLTEYPTIKYLKWDHNRVVIDAAHFGQAAVHRQTKAVYRLLDELKQRHPGLEIESCSSGGGRIDLGILQHTDRVWVSDSNDALERQRMHRWTSQVLPPELQGSHIGPHHAHTSGRTHDLSFRAVTALFWHAGLEWDITTTTAEERQALKGWADFYKANRDLLHTGRMVRVDHPESVISIHGVVAHDQSRALFAYVQEGVCASSRPASLRLPGLDPDRLYRVQEERAAGAPNYWQIDATPWMVDGVVLSGRSLLDVGLVAPILTSEQAVLLSVTAV